MKKKLGLLPKKLEILSDGQQKALKATLAGTAALAAASCKSGGGDSSGGAFLPPVLASIPDIAVQEGQMITLSPSAVSQHGKPVFFRYSGFMTSSTRQTSAGDAGIYSVTVTASDGTGTDSQVVRIVVYSGTPTAAALHMGRRITFGMSPFLYHELDVMGAQGYLNQQLNPSSIDDSQFRQRMANVTVTDNDPNDLKAWSLMHMIYSRKQLQEVMTWFWDNHFNTDINVLRGRSQLRDNRALLEKQENEAFRANALGNFRQLLELSAKSPTMLHYLDSASNRANDSNENYSRELLELHTMGVNGGYTHHDIEAGAEIFTGWHERDLQFSFNAAQHNSVTQTYLGQNIPAGGVEQGERVLDILSQHTSTANFICTKLVTLFVSDDPPAALVAAAASTFRAAALANAPDQIAQVLRVILQSQAFRDATYQKVKTPVEFATTIVRGLQAETDGTRLHRFVESMGVDLYENLLPTGWSEKGVDWTSAGLMVERLKTAEFLLRVNRIDYMRAGDYRAFVRSNGSTTANAIADFLLNTLLGSYPAAARTNVVNYLNGGASFDINAGYANTRLRNTLLVVMSYPQFQYQ